MRPQLWRKRVEQTVRGSQGELAALLDGVREVCRDPEQVGMLFGRVEVLFGANVATRLFLTASKAGLPVNVLHYGKGFAARQAEHPPELFQRLLAIATQHGDVAGAVQLLKHERDLLPREKMASVVRNLLQRAPPSSSVEHDRAVEALLSLVEGVRGRIDADLLNTALKKTRGQPDRVDRVLQQFVQQGLTPDGDTFRHLFEFYGRRSDADAVRMVRESASEYGLRREWRVLAAAALALGRCALPDQIRAVLGEMRDGQVATEEQIVRLEAEALALAGEFAGAEDALRRLDPPRERDFAALMHAYLAKGRAYDALQCFERMLARGVRAELAAYRALVAAYQFGGHVAGVTAVLAEMAERGVAPDARSYGDAMLTFAGAGDVDAVERLYREARVERALPMTEHMLRARIRVHLRHGNGKLARASLFRAWEQQWRPQTPTIRELLAYFAARGEEHAVDDVLREVQARGGALDPELYESVLSARFAAKNYTGVVRSFREVAALRAGGRTTVAAYQLLLAAVRHTPHRHQAVAIFDRLVEEGLTPSPNVVAQLLACTSGRSADVAAVLARMERWRVPGSRRLWSAVATSLAGAGEVDHAVKVLDLMRARSFRVDGKVLYGVLPALVRADRRARAVQLVEHADEVDARCLGILLRSAPTGSEGEALLERAVRLQLAEASMFTAVVQRYVDEGRIDAAERIWDRMRRREVAARPGELGEALLALATGKKSRWVREVFENNPQMRSNSPASWAAVVRALCRESRYQDALRLLGRAHTSGRQVAQSSRIYHEYLRAVAAKGMVRRARRAVELMRERNIRVNMYTDSLVVQATGEARDSAQLRELARGAYAKLHTGATAGHTSLRNALEDAAQKCGILLQEDRPETATTTTVEGTPES